MTIWQAAVLGVIQGLTEFLPISSSGHLVLAQYFLGLTEPLLTFDIFLHFGTLLAVVVFFFKRLLAIRTKYLWALLIGTIPAGLVGILFEDTVELLFALPIFVGFEMLFNAVINYLTHRKLQQQAQLQTSELDDQLQVPTTKQAVIVGLLQALSISPGISRSGTTVFGGLYGKLNRISAFEFSFLLSIPAILGANVLHLLDVTSQPNAIDWLPIAVGTLLAFAVGFASLKLLEYMMKQAKFSIFAWYCLVLGLVIIFLA